MDLHRQALIDIISEWDLIGSEQRESLIAMVVILIFVINANFTTFNENDECLFLEQLKNVRGSEGILRNVFNVSLYKDYERVGLLSLILHAILLFICLKFYDYLFITLQ